MYSIADYFHSLFSVLTRPARLTKYGTTRKNTQRYYAPKCLIRHIRYISPHPMVAHSKTDQMKQVRLTCRRVVSGTCHDLSWGGGGGAEDFFGGSHSFQGGTVRGLVVPNRI